MNQDVSLCVFCREENASLIKITLNSRRKSASPWSEVLVIELGFQRRTAEGLPRARYLRLEEGEDHPLAFAARHSRSDWLLLLEAGEQVRVDGGFHPAAPFHAAFSIPVSDHEEGWEPGFSPRLIHRSAFPEQASEGISTTFLCAPFSVSRPFHYASFRVPPPVFPGSGAGRHYLLGEAARREGHYRKAADCFSKAYRAAEEPLLKRFFTYKKVSCLLRHKPGDGFLPELARAENQFPYPSEFAFAAGRALYGLRCYREALACFSRAGVFLRAAPGGLPWGPENFVVTAEKARSLRALGQKESSLEACTHALTCCPGYLPAFRLLAKIVLHQEPGLDGTRLLYRHASPLQQGQYAVLGRLFLEHRRLPEALAWITSGLKESPGNLELNFLRGTWSFIKGETGKCLAFLRKITGDSIYFREAFWMRCLCLWHMTDYRRALQLLDSAAGHLADSEGLSFCRSLHYHIQAGSKTLALKPLQAPAPWSDPAFLKLVELSRHLPSRKVFYILVRLAKTLDRGPLNLQLAKHLARHREQVLAVTFFNRALRQEAYDSESLLFMGTMAMEEALFSEAREFFRMALVQYPQDAGIYLACSRALLQEAAFTMQQGLQRNPHNLLEKTVQEVQTALKGLESLELDL